MAYWHGLRPAGYRVGDAVRIPGVLRRFYESYGSQARSFLVNELQQPDDWYDDDGHRVFYVEEQGVFVWGISHDQLDADDPPVFLRENAPGSPWVEESAATSVFLLQLVVASAAFMAPHGAAAAWLPQDDADLVLAPLTSLDLPPWRWPTYPARLHASEEAVAFMTPNQGPAEVATEAGVSMWVGSLSAAGVSFIEPHLSDAWEYYSPRDGAPC